MKKTGKVVVVNPKKKNRQDATIINVRAANRRIKALEQNMVMIGQLYNELSARVRKLEGK